MSSRGGRVLGTSVRSSLLVGLAATALVLTTAGGALASSDPVPGAPVYQAFDPGRISPQFRPAALRSAADVTAVLQLAGTPVALVEAAQVRRGSALTEATRSSVRRALRARQDALRPALAAAGARVIGQYQDAYNGIKVRVPGRNLVALAALPGVVRISPAPVYRLKNATSEAYTGVPKAWAQGAGVTGTGIKIAVIDTGIDYYHADFDGSGDPADFAADDGLTIGTPAFPNAKVAGGFDFVGDDYDPSGFGDTAIPKPDLDPLDCDGHGTHVAATAAGLGVNDDGSTYNGPYTAAALSRHAFRVAPGAAPGAQVYALRVFGCSGATDVLLEAIDWAVKNQMDVVNMSIGGTFGTADSPDAVAVENAVKAGVVVVAAAGNEGPGAYTVASPGVAPGAISVGAVDALRTLPGATIALTMGPVLAINANRSDTFPITGRLLVLRDASGGIGLGCDESEYAAVQPGDIVVTQRGDCPRTDRPNLGEAAGAAAVVMVNAGSATGLPPFEGPIPDVTIPFLGVTSRDGALLQAAANQLVTITAGPDISNPSYARATDFSSSGPTSGTSALKPDVMAPGASVLSAAVGTGTDGITESGTSMASPLVAGIAALVREAHPAWTPLQVKAAIVSTASGAVGGYDPRQDGSGLVQAQDAVDAVAYAAAGDGASLSFGAVALNGAWSASRTITLVNTSASAIDYRLSPAFVGARLGARMTLSSSRVVVPAHGTSRVTATLSLSAAAVAALPGAESPTDGRGLLTAVRGVIIATPARRPTGVHTLRVPFLVVPRGLSDVQTPSTVELTASGGAHVTGKATVTNRGVHAGVADVFAWGLRAGTVGAGSGDVRAIGVQSRKTGMDGRPLPTDVRMLVFAVNTYRPWSSAALNEFDIFIDSDGTGDNTYILSILDHGVATSGAPDGIPACIVVRFSDFAIVGAAYAKAPANSSTLTCAVLTSTMAPMGPGQPFSYVAFTTFGDLPVSGGLPGEGTFDPFEPAISQGDRLSLAPGKSGSIDLWVDPERFANAPALGWLIVSPDDASGPGQAEGIPAIVPPSG